MLAVFLLSVFILVAALSLAGAQGFRDGRGRVRWALALLYMGFGALHVFAPDSFTPIMPPALPFPRAIVIITGGCEVVGALGLILPATRRWAGVCLAIYAVCVFPANIYHAYAHVVVPGLPSSLWYHIPRLLFQPVFSWWALYAGEVIDWPFSPHRPAFTHRVKGS